MVFLVRRIRFKYMRTSSFKGEVEMPLARAWAEMIGDEEVAASLAAKKKVAAKLLLRFISYSAGSDALEGFRKILTKLTGFSKAYEPVLLQSCRELAKSGKTIDDEDN